jgi:pyruvate formate lyase activating enzyme
LPEGGVVFDLKRFSVHDGPGIRTTVFFKGCPLNCWWCHNPEGQAEEPELMLRPDRCIGCGACVDVCENEAIVTEGDVLVTRRERCTACGACVDVCYADARVIVGKRMTVDQVMAEIERDVPFYDQSGGGVTISGGEPLAQPEFLDEILRACKQRGLHTALDTCGFSPWADLDWLRRDVDLFLYDLKLMDAERHRKCAGVSNEQILENLQRLSGREHRIVLRVPVIPGVNDDEENLRQMGAFAAELPSLERVDLLPYHRIGRDKYRGLGKACTMSDTLPPSDGRMVEVAQTFRTFDLRVTIGG